MKTRFAWVALFVVASIACFGVVSRGGRGEAKKKTEITMVIHGGAGTITRERMTPEKERAITEKLSEALESGVKILRDGGAALDAVEASIRVLEDSPLFNAGKGAVFTADGKNEMDASIMDGNTLKAGAVASVTTIKNPISAARAVMEKTKHVLLIGEGAERFAAGQGLEIVDPAYFFDQDRWDELQKAKEEQGSSMREPARGPLGLGTVGALALDSEGNLAAGTSTGGLTNKMHGRVGDSPIIGAGTYANNRTCAVSGTGQGEYFIRLSIARDVSSLMEYKGWGVEKAAHKVVDEKLTALGGTGGIIALDRNGRIAMPFNTAGMYRAWMKADGVAHVSMFKDEVK